MSAKNLRNRMGDHHEAHIAAVFGVRRTRGSGSHWRDQTDARSHRLDEAVAFAWDGKSTRAASITISRADLDKLVEQAHAERPCLAVRFYDDDRLTGYEDWDLIREDDLVELLDRSRRLDELQRALDRLGAETIWQVFPAGTEDSPRNALLSGVRGIIEG